MIKGYFLLQKKQRTIHDFADRMLEIVWQTIIPLIGAYGLFITSNPLFISIIILPMVLNIKLEKQNLKITPGQMKKKYKELTDKWRGSKN